MNFGNINNKFVHESYRVLYISSSQKWMIREETGVLCLRNSFNPGDFRYAFFPGSGKINYGSNINLDNSVVPKVLYQGHRWSINDENGILVFRDNISPGDHRYAFEPAKKNMW